MADNYLPGNSKLWEDYGPPCGLPARSQPAGTQSSGTRQRYGMPNPQNEITVPPLNKQRTPWPKCQKLISVTGRLLGSAEYRIVPPMQVPIAHCDHKTTNSILLCAELKWAPFWNILCNSFWTPKMSICSIWCHYVMEYLILKLLYYPYSNLASMLNALTVCQNTTNKDGWNPLIKYMTTLPATSWKHTARSKLSSEWKIMFVASPNLKEDISLNWKLVLIIYR